MTYFNHLAFSMASRVEIIGRLYRGGGTPMTVQRRWRAKRRRQDARAAPVPADPPEPPDHGTQSDRAPDRQELTRQLDEAGREPVEPREATTRTLASSATADIPTGFVTAERRRFTLFLCNGCIHEMMRRSDWIVGRETM
jgi:hypothetical protein